MKTETNNHLLLLRIITDLLLLVFVFVAPWWLIFLFAVFLIFYFNFYIEAVLSILIVDLLYSGQSFLLGADFLTVFMLICFVGIQILKKKIIFY